MPQNTYAGSYVELKKFYERRGRTAAWEREYSIRLEGIQKVVHEIRPYLQGGLVLDVGCGSGIPASLFPPNSRVIGLDFSISMLRRARRRIPQLVQGSGLNLPFDDCCFDVITCLFVASDYSDKQDIFHEAFRVLKENGVFAFSDYSLKDEHWKLRRTIRPLLGEQCHICLEDELSLSEKMREAGLRVEEMKLLRFNASFKLGRYIKSEEEMRQLKTSSLDLWNDVRQHIKNGKIEREFLFMIGLKMGDGSND